MSEPNAEIVDNHCEVSALTFEGYAQVTVRAGRSQIVRVVPPAGEEHAFCRQEWDHLVTVAVSPAGRSVRVWIDGVEQSVGPGRLGRRRRRES